MQNLYHILGVMMKEKQKYEKGVVCLPLTCLECSKFRTLNPIRYNVYRNQTKIGKLVELGADKHVVLAATYNILHFSSYKLNSTTINIGPSSGLGPHETTHPHITTFLALSSQLIPLTLQNINIVSLPINSLHLL